MWVHKDLKQKKLKKEKRLQKQAPVFSKEEEHILGNNPVSLKCSEGQSAACSVSTETENGTNVDRKPDRNAPMETGCPQRWSV